MDSNPVLQCTSLVVFLYTNNEVAEKDIKKIISFIIAPKRNKIPMINLTKEGKYMDPEERSWRQHKQMEIYSLFMEELIFWKCSYYPKQSTDSICNPHQNSNSVIHRTRTNNTEIYIESQKTLNTQSNLEIGE